MSAPSSTPNGVPGDSVGMSPGNRTNRFRRSSAAIAPGKAILFGEHAINRGQAAYAASVGLYARCRVSLPENEAGLYRFRAGAREQSVSRGALLEIARRVDGWREASDYDAIRRLSGGDYFASSEYVLASMFGEALPPAMEIEWESEIPPSAGLGSGGAAFTALVTAATVFLPEPPTIEARAGWAHRGDIIAHGGVASALDTQTSLLGGVIRYTGDGLAEPVPVAPGFHLVIGDTGVFAATSEVNDRVRRWLEERYTPRMVFFRTIGIIGRAARPMLESGDWSGLGSLFILNQLVLREIGVSCPEIERLIDAVMEAGAFGAKLSGSGGGGIIIVLAPEDAVPAIEGAIQSAGGVALTPETGVSGSRGMNV